NQFQVRSVTVEFSYQVQHLGFLDVRITQTDKNLLQRFLKARVFVPEPFAGCSHQFRSGNIAAQSKTLYQRSAKAVVRNFQGDASGLRPPVEMAERVHKFQRAEP